MPAKRFLLTALLLAIAAAPAGAAAAGWSTPRTLGASDPDMNDVVHTALNARGEAVAAWSTPSFEVAVALARRAPRFGASRVLARHSRSASVAIGADGTALVAWTQGRVVMAAVRRPGHGFGRPVRLSGPLSRPRGDDGAVAAIAGDGTLLVAWAHGLTLGSTRATASVMVAQAPPGGSFGAPVRIGASDLSGGPRLVAAADGSATVAFVSPRPAGVAEARVMVATRPAGGAFGPPTPISPAEPAFGPIVVRPASGGAWVDWFVLGTKAQGGRVRAAFAAAGTFGAPVAGPPARVRDFTAAGLGGGATGLLWTERLPHRPFGFPYRSLHAVIARPDGSVGAPIGVLGEPGVAGPLATGLEGGDALVLGYKPVGNPRAFRAVRFIARLLAADGSVTPVAAPGGLHTQPYTGVFDGKAVAAAGRRVLVIWLDGHRVRVSARTIPVLTP